MIPFEIAYDNQEPSADAERHVPRGVERLERVSPDLIAVHVTLTRRHGRHATGSLHHVHLRLVRPGQDVSVSRTPPAHAESESLVSAIGEAFDTARRELIERRDVRRGDVKAHEGQHRGEITELFPDYGFIRGSDDRLVYFHRNSVVGHAWDEIHPGDPVCFADEQGDKGPQATTVTVER